MGVGLEKLLEDATLMSDQDNLDAKKEAVRLMTVHLAKGLEFDSVLASKLSVIPQKYRKTLTRDRGKENLAWEHIEEVLGLKVFLAHSCCSWERGSNENCNGLLRRYFPKGTDWSKISDKKIAHAEYLINTRPRKRLGWKTPAEVFYQETGVALFSVLNVA